MIKLTKTLMGFAFFAPYSLLLATQKQEINLNQNPTSLSKTNHYNHSHTLCSKIGGTNMPRESASYRATPNRSYNLNEFKISLSIEKKDFSDDSKHDDNQVKHGMGYVEATKEIYMRDDLDVLGPDNKDGGFKVIFGDATANLERASYNKKKMGQNQDLQITSNAQRRVLDKVKQREKKVKKNKINNHFAIATQLQMFKLAQAVKQSYYQEMDDKDSKIARRKTIYRWLDKRELSKDASEDAKEWHDRIVLPEKVFKEFMENGHWYANATQEKEAILRYRKSNLPLKKIQNFVREYINNCTFFSAIIDQESNNDNNLEFEWAAYIPCSCSRFSPDGKRLAIDHKGSITIYNSVSGKKLLGPYPHYSFKFSPDSKYLAIENKYGLIIYDFVSSKKIPDPNPCSYKFSPDSKLLAVYNQDSITIYYSVSGKKISVHYCSSYCSFEFSPDSKLLAIYDGGEVIIYNLKNGNKISDPYTCSYYHSYRFSPDSKRLAVYNHDGVTIHDFVNRTKILDSFFCLFSFSPDSKLLAIENKGSVIIYNPVNGNKISGPYLCSCNSDFPYIFSPDSKIIAIENKGRVTIYNPVNGDEIFGPIPCYFSYSYCPFDFSNDSKLLAIEDEDSVTIYNAVNGKKISVHYCSYCCSYGFTNDSKLLAIEDEDSVMVYDVMSSNKIFNLTSYSSSCSSCFFSPEGNLLAIDDKDSVTIYGPYAPLSVVPKKNKNFVPNTRHPELFDKKGQLKLSNDEFKKSLDSEYIMLDAFIDNGVCVHKKEETINLPKKYKRVFSAKQKYMFLQNMLKESIKEREKEKNNNHCMKFVTNIELFPLEIEKMIIRAYLQEHTSQLELDLNVEKANKK